MKKLVLGMLLALAVAAPGCTKSGTMAKPSTKAAVTERKQTNAVENKTTNPAAPTNGAASTTAAKENDMHDKTPATSPSTKR